MAQFLSFMQLKKNRRRARKGAEFGRQRLEKGFNEAKGYWQPQYDFGQASLSDFENWLQKSDDISSDPSYQWRLNEGNRTLENSAAAKGGLMSGNALRGISDYGQQSASKEYQNEFNRYMQRVGLGQNATGAMAGLASAQGMASGQMAANNAQQDYQNLINQWLTSASVGKTANDVAISWMGGGMGGAAKQPSGGGGGNAAGSNASGGSSTSLGGSSGFNNWGQWSGGT